MSARQREIDEATDDSWMKDYDDGVWAKTDDFSGALDDMLGDLLGDIKLTGA